MSFRRAQWNHNGAGEPAMSITDEIVTGYTWTDGKPIYRKGYSGTTGTTVPEISINTSALGIESPIKYWGIIYNGSTWQRMDGSEHNSDVAQQLRCRFRISEFRAESGNNSVTRFDSRDYKVWIYYTKA